MAFISGALKALLLILLADSAAGKNLRGLQLTSTAPPTLSCARNNTACNSLSFYAGTTCCSGLVCQNATAAVITASTGFNATSQKTTSYTGVCALPPTAPPSPAPTPCPCRNETQTCVDDLIGSDTCCNGLYCSAYPGSGQNGTCIKPTPAPTPSPKIWQIPSLIQAGGYNSYVDIANPDNIGGPKVGNGSQIAYILPGESATYGINVTRNGTYGIQYLLTASGNPDTPPPLSMHMTIGTNCSATAGRFGLLNVTAFAPQGAAVLNYRVGTVNMTTSMKTLTVCFDDAGYVEVEAYAFGNPESGIPTLPPTAAPTPSPTAAPTPQATNRTVNTTAPSPVPTVVNTSAPSPAPTSVATIILNVTAAPTNASLAPTPQPTNATTLAPTSAASTASPTAAATTASTNASAVIPINRAPAETAQPTIIVAATTQPTVIVAVNVTSAPTNAIATVAPSAAGTNATATVPPTAAGTNATVKPTTAVTTTITTTTTTTTTTTANATASANSTANSTAAGDAAIGANPNKNNTIPGNILATNFLKYTDGISNNAFVPASGHIVSSPGAGLGGSTLAYINTGDSAVYSVRASKADTYAVKYYLAGAPPNPVPLDMYLISNGTCTTGIPQAELKNATFAPTSYDANIGYAAGNATLPSGTQNITLCFKTASYINMDYISFTSTSV